MTYCLTGGRVGDICDHPQRAAAQRADRNIDIKYTLKPLCPTQWRAMQCLIDRGFSGGGCIVGFFDLLRDGFAKPGTTSLASLIAPRVFHHLGEEIQLVRPVLACIFRSSNFFVSCTLRLLDDVTRPQGNLMQIAIENTCLLIGRFLLGLYFILPGISKITGYEGTVTYMEVHNVPMISALLPLTIVMQLVLGAALIVGFRGKLAAFFLAGLTLVISVYMHNFWDFAEGMERNHETQNFFKNMGITAGLLMVAALGTGRFSIDKYLAKRAAGA